jgi:glycosyltransferase involved in cell wall biosynthesis
VGREFFELGLRRSPEPFILSVSTLHPHKNLDGLLRGFAEFRRTRPDYRLVVAGMRGFFTRELSDLREALKLGDAVNFPGWLEREQLLDLYTRASAFVYPSHFEGFGMPVLEALAAGIPTACSAIEPLVSIAGGAALHFDQRDPGAICGALLRLVEDAPLRARLADAGPARAALFPWERTAQMTLECLQTAAM